MLTNGDFYSEPGGDFYARRQPEKTKARALDQLRKMGYAVTLNPLTDAGCQGIFASAAVLTRTFLTAEDLHHPPVTPV